jgi:hypothetical protein
VQIIVPEDSVATPPGNQVPGERIGNLAREEAYSIATFMDDKVDLLTNNNLYYAVDFKFSCTLSENFHHRVEGYEIQIIVYSNFHAQWTPLLINTLKAQNLNVVEL